MPLNLLVVDTAAVSVKLRLDACDNAGGYVTPNSPNHVCYKVFVDRVDFTAFSHIGSATQFIYHRLAITLPVQAVNDYLRPTTGELPQATSDDASLSEARRYVVLTPSDIEHAGKFVTDNGFKSFSNSRITFSPTGNNTVVGGNTYLGKITRKFGDVTKNFKFELQYQYDPMNGGTGTQPAGPVQTGAWIAPNPIAPPTAGRWTEYQQETDENIIVTGSDDLTYKLKVYHVNRADYDPAAPPLTRIWYASNNINVTPGTTINIDGYVYTPAAATLAETWLVNQLWTGAPATFNGTVNTAVDYVLEVIDAEATTSVDDSVDVVATGKGRLSIGNHILYRQGGQLVGSGGTLKLFKGRTTRIYTDLTNWAHVALHSYDLNDFDDDALIKTDTTLGQFSGWATFDIDQTVIGVNTTPTGIVYLQVYLGPNSTGVSFDNLYVTHDNAVTNLISSYPLP